MKKGFTLIELLAVIVVLSIILVIAVPNIMKIIDKTRIDAYIKNEEMMVNAVKKYLVNNSLSVPVNIGDTVEITLDDLKSNKLIDNIVDSKDNDECNGYILVTKIGDNQYDYNPHLNCVSDIGSSTEDGLVGYWKLDGNATDSSIYNNHGIINGAIAGIDQFGMINRAMQFDGVDDYINFGNNAVFDITTNITLSIWVRLNNILETYDSLIWKTNTALDAAQSSYGLSMTSGQKARFVIGSKEVASDNLFPLQEWFHIAGVYDGSKMKLYYNGNLVKQINNTSAISVSSQDLTIGRRKFNNTFYYQINGSLDNVRIYNRALSDAEIEQLYNMEKYRGN